MLFEEFDGAKYLETEEDIAVFLEDMLENGSQSDFIKALETVARARGITELAQKAGVERNALYQMLVNGTAPRLDIVLKILDALGLRFVITPKTATYSPTSNIQEIMAEMKDGFPMVKGW